MPGFILNTFPVLTHLILTTTYEVVLLLLIFSNEETDHTERSGFAEVLWLVIVEVGFRSSHWCSEQGSATLPALSRDWMVDREA